MTQLRDYQAEAVQSIYDWFDAGKGNPLVVAPTGCHAAGTMILMHDGSVKPVENVTVGDSLMGPDSLPRTVLQLCRGQEEMFRVTPVKGEPFVVNAGHVLSLKTTNSGKAWEVSGGQVEAVTVSEWLEKANYWRHLRKLHRAAVDFPARENPGLSAYVVGALIGDGCLSRGVKISNPDPEILDAVWAEAERLGLKYVAREKIVNISNWDVSFVRIKGTAQKNSMAEILDRLGLLGTLAHEKFIPDCYKLGDREARLQVLAGILDTDGHLSRAGFDYISKSQRLSEDVAFVARSLGLAAYVTECTKSYPGAGQSWTYWRVSISGDCDIIPTIVPRKKAPQRAQKKNPLVTGFSVEPVGEGDFFGFTLDRDHLYLTADFTVHHNSGKSVILSEFCRRALTEYPETRIVVAQHVKELIQQNATALMRLWPGAPVGIYSAGLGVRQRRQVTFAGIQSVARKASEFGFVDLLLIDEAHLLPRNSDTQYQTFIAGLKDTNPALKVIGLTATPFRLDSGRLDRGKGAIFDGICYDIPIPMLVKRGYLAPLISKKPGQVFDTAGLHTRGGDYIESEMVARFDTEAVTRAAVQEIVAAGQDRRSWLLFCISVEHAARVRDEVRRHGITAEMVTGATPPDERARILADFKDGRIRALTNVYVLTTGFDAPATDLLAFLRPTHSLGLYMQMAGRAMRTAPGKDNGFVLDFAGNVARHGPVDAVSVSDARENGEGGKREGEAQTPAKTCPGCQSILWIGARQCPDCGHEFPEPEPKIEKRASTEAIMNLTAEDDWRQVADMSFRRHVKGDTASLRVEYLVAQTGIRGVSHRVVSEFVCLEHGGFPRQKAVQWWHRMAGTSPPDTVAEAIARIGEVRVPEEAVIRKEGEFWRITRTRGDARKAGAA